MSNFEAARKWLEYESARGNQTARSVLAEVDRLTACWDDGRAEYRVVWQIVEQLGLSSLGGCPDARIVDEVERMKAELAATRSELLKVNALMLTYKAELAAERERAERLERAVCEALSLDGVNRERERRGLPIIYNRTVFEEALRDAAHRRKP